MGVARRRVATRRNLPWVGCLLAVAWSFPLDTQAAFAEGMIRSREDVGLFYCETPSTGALADPEARRRVQLDARLNAAHGLAYVAGAAAIQFGTSPTRRWSAGNAFDDGIRNGLRAGSSSVRQGADIASDVTLAVGIGLLPLASMGAQFFRTHDCLETLDMTSDWIESFGLTLMITQATKVASGRERPYTEECDGNPPRDVGCGNADRNLSFFSGHASLAAAGAGLTCSFSLERKVWGTSTSARIAPCALGITTALATGALRITSDKHWGTDVIVGFAVGGLIGYFDTWGPLDLLRFETRDSGGRVSATGLVLPLAEAGRLGAQAVIVF